MSRISHFGFAIAMVFGISRPVTADLIFTIDGVDNSEQFTWTFEGSVVAVGSGYFQSNGDLANDTSWQDVGSIVTDASFNDLEMTPPVSGAATISVEAAGGGTEIRSINLGYLDDDGAGAVDDFGIGVDGSSLSFANGDTVTISGSLVFNGLNGLDITDLQPRGTVYSLGSYGVGSTLAGELRIGALSTTSAVPEPGSFAILGVATAVGAFMRRYRRNQG